MLECSKVPIGVKRGSRRKYATFLCYVRENMSQKRKVQITFNDDYIYMIQQSCQLSPVRVRFKQLECARILPTGSIFGGLGNFRIGSFGTSYSAPFTLSTTLHFWWILFSATFSVGRGSAIFACLSISGRHAGKCCVW